MTTEAAVYVMLQAFAKAFRRKFDTGQVAVYQDILSRHTDDPTLVRAMKAIISSEERFPTIATVLRYCRGEMQEPDTGFIRGTNIRTRDYIRDPSRYADEVAAKSVFWKDADEQHRYERAAHAMPRSEHPLSAVDTLKYIASIAEVAEGLKPKPVVKDMPPPAGIVVKQEKHAKPKPEPRDADRPNRKAGKKVHGVKREAPF